MPLEEVVEGPALEADFVVEAPDLVVTPMISNGVEKIDDAWRFTYSNRATSRLLSYAWKSGSRLGGSRWRV